MSFSQPKRILVSNRGEIAVRIMRACRELGLTSVFFYPSVGDFAMERAFADESYEITTDNVYAPFLNIETIISFAQVHAIDGVHPGYGFLSESAILARACLEAGITFIGPSSETLALTGDKVAAKSFAKEQGIPVLKSSSTLTTGEELLSVLHQEHWKYPLFLKASHGGGGKGMHEVQSADEASAIFRQVQEQAQAYFGEAACYLEEACSNPRHVEVQVLGNGKDQYLAFPERDCTLQRRHQKVIEETPSPFIDEKTRIALKEAAVTLARALQLQGVGTVEFLVTPDQRFFFLEVNPRIQVEHGVTELLTGIDLVQVQLHLAFDLPVNIYPHDLAGNGWAMQCRILAENPLDNFAPAAGVVSHFRPPSGPGVRVDDALHSGQNISPYFDSLLAKVMVSSQTRSLAIKKMIHVLEELVLEGIATNVSLLQSLLHSVEFQHARHTTTFVEDFVATTPLETTESRLAQKLPTPQLAISEQDSIQDEAVIASLVAELYHKLVEQETEVSDEVFCPV